MSGSIRFRLFRPSDREGLLDLFRAVYAGEAERKTSSWRYLDRPPMRAWISVAEADGRIVGAQPGHEVTVRIDGTPVRGALLLDVMTHPDYRRRGVFTGVVETLRRACHENGVSLLLTTPNEAAARGFRKLPAWTPLGEICPLVHPLSLAALFVPSFGSGMSDAPGEVARARVGRHRSEDASPPASVRISEQLDTSLDILCEEFAGIAPFMIVKDPDFLRWRFSRQSGRSYRFFLHNSEGRCDGLAITTPRTLLGRRLMLIVELIVAAGGGEAVDPLLRAVRQQAAETRAAAVLTYLPPHSPLLPLLSHRGFRSVPRILRPRDYTIWVAADSREPRSARAREFSGWHMSLADSDLA